MKHHRVNIASTCEAIKDHNILVPYCPTDEQAADIFTNALTPAKWPAALNLLRMDTSKRPDANESPYRHGKCENVSLMPALPTIQENQPLAQVFRGLVATAQDRLSEKHSHHLLAKHFAMVHNAMVYPPEPVPTTKRNVKLSGSRQIIEVCCD